MDPQKLAQVVSLSWLIFIDFVCPPALSWLAMLCRYNFLCLFLGLCHGILLKCRDKAQLNSFCDCCDIKSFVATKFPSFYSLCRDINFFAMTEFLIIQLCFMS